MECDVSHIAGVCIYNTMNIFRKLILRKTRKGSKAYLSSSERYLTLHIIRHRP